MLQQIDGEGGGKGLEGGTLKDSWGLNGSLKMVKTEEKEVKGRERSRLVTWRRA